MGIKNIGLTYVPFRVIYVIPKGIGRIIMNINSITSNRYPLSQLLDPDSTVVYTIPKYQREYIWGTKQWEELFNDLIENDNGYFL